MPYSAIQQATLDLNWYFVDRFNRICVAASAGGVLPQLIADNYEKNDQFHEAVMALPPEYMVVTNERILNLIKGIEKDMLDDYFKDFKDLASRGLFVFDRVNLEDSKDGIYLLVAHPVYDTRVDSAPLEVASLRLVPRLTRSIIVRFNQQVKPSSFDPINLVEVVNRHS